VSAGRAAGLAWPVHVAPAGFMSRAEQEQLLEAALAGIELGGYDRRIAAWMASWDTPTLLTVVSWIVRARAAGPAQ
jgi:hypothetical protein